MVTKWLFCHLWCYQIWWPFLGVKPSIHSVHLLVISSEISYQLRSSDPTQNRESDCIWLHFPLEFLTSCISWNCSSYVSTKVHFYFLPSWISSSSYSQASETSQPQIFIHFPYLSQELQFLRACLWALLL